MKRSIIAIAASAAMAASILGANPAQAGGRHDDRDEPRVRPVSYDSTTIASNLFTPLSLAVDDRGSSYVSQNFAGELLRIAPDGTRTTLATVPGQEVGGVSVRGRTVYLTTTGQDPATPSAALWKIKRDGTLQQLADLRAYEETQNPDAGTTYGFVDLPAACAAQFPADFPATYTGLVDAHPYATLPTRRGAVYVADAAANAILKVSKRGTVSTVAVLPPTETVEVTAEAATAQGLPACVAGFDYRFEFVPTDVEQGPDGSLYVTSLPGGPEDASLGARGAVHKVSPWSGRARKVAGGFVGAVNLAVGPRGEIAVAELFGGDEGTGQVTILKPGSSRRSVLPLAAPGAVEWTDGRRGALYATTSAFVPGPDGAPQAIGELVRVRLGRH